MNLRSFDLNLLVVFGALYEERSVTRTAKRLGMTQSAVSHALRRLRENLNDELMVRADGGLQPTPQAVKLASAFTPALERIADVLDVKREFDPAQARRTFHISVSDYVGASFVPHLARRMREEAPDISLDIQSPDGSRTSKEVAYDGIEVRLSVVTGSVRPSHWQRWMEDRFVVLMRKGHPAARKPLTLGAYLALAHMKVTGVGSSLIDETLALSGKARRVLVKVPSWQGMVPVIETTDLVGVVPEHWTRGSNQYAGCVVRPLPIDGLTLTIEAAWHPRNNDDPGHTWFRGLVQEIFLSLQAFAAP